MRRSTDRLLAPSLLALLVSCFALPSNAQAQDLSPSSKLDLASGMAREFGFVELAQSLIEEVRSGDEIPAEKLEYTLATLLRDAIASSAPDLNSNEVDKRAAAYRQRLSAYDQAIDAFDLYLADRDRTYQRSQAARAMLALVQEKLDITLFWLGDDGRQTAELRAELIDKAVEAEVQSGKRWQAAVRHAEEETSNIEQALDSLDAGLTGDPDNDNPILEEMRDLEVESARLQFEKGEIYLSQYKLLKEKDPNDSDADDFLSVARRAFGQIANNMGDSSNAGMAATSRQAECYLYQGQASKALRYFSRVFSAAVPIPNVNEGEHIHSIEPLERQWKFARDDEGMSAAEYQGYLRGRRRPMCQAYETAIRLFRARGFVPEALDISEQFLAERTRWRLATESEEPALRELGNFKEAYRATLEAGIILALAGRTGDAVALTWDVASQNLDNLTVRPRDRLGYKAIEAIREIAASAGEGFLNAEQYRAAAVSAYLEKDYVGALSLLRKALRRFGERGAQGDLVESETFLVFCYGLMSRCQTLRTEGGAPRRHLATTAARHGSLYFYEADERYAGFSSPRCEVTNRFNSYVRLLAQEDPASVTLTEAWKDEAQVLKVARCNEGIVEQLIRDGIAAMNSQRYPKAIREFERVAKEEPDHPKTFQALVLAGRCRYERKEWPTCATAMEEALKFLAERKKTEQAKGRVFTASRESSYVEQAHYYAGRCFQVLHKDAKDEEKAGLARKAVGHFTESSEEPWNSFDVGSLSLYYGIPLLVELDGIAKAREWFTVLDEKAGSSHRSRITGPAFAIYRAVKPEEAPDADVGLDPRYDEATYERFRQAAYYLGRMNSGKTPLFANLFLEAKYMLEFAKTGETGAAEAALEKWMVIKDDPAAERYGNFARQIARTRLLIGGVENFRQAAETFAAECFYPYTRDSAGKQDWSANENWNNGAGKRKMPIKFRGMSEGEYLRDDVTGASLRLCAMTYAGWISPNVSDPTQAPVRTPGLGELLFSANPTDRDAINAATRSHVIGKECWGYLLQLNSSKASSEMYLDLRLKYDYAKALLAKTIEPNTREINSIQEALDGFKRITGAGDDWEDLCKDFREEPAKRGEVGEPIPEDRAKAWAAAYRWLEGYLGG